MNNNLIYSFKGFMLAVLFIAAIKFISFTYTLYFPNKTASADTIVKAPAPYFFVINERGKKLFQDSCSACHSISMRVEGPTLENIEDRVTSCEILYEYIRNSKKVIESGDPYFTQLYEAFNKIQMKSFPNLTDSDIDDILIYINQYYENKYHKISSAAN